MSNFSLGLILGTAVGAGMIIAIHPMDRRARRKACCRANKIMRHINHSIHSMV